MLKKLLFLIAILAILAGISIGVWSCDNGGSPESYVPTLTVDTLNGATISATPGAGVIPIADGNGKLDAWVSQEPTYQARAYRATSNQSVQSGVEAPVRFNAISYDEMSEFDLSEKTGTATATTAFHLIDTTKNQFVAGDVGKYILNTTDTTYTKIMGYNSPSDITLEFDIMANGENYVLYCSRFVAQKAGTYLAIGFIYYPDVGTNTWAAADLFVNSVFPCKSYIGQQAGTNGEVKIQVTDILKLSVGDYVHLGFYQSSGSTKNIRFGVMETFLAVTRLGN